MNCSPWPARAISLKLQVAFNHRWLSSYHHGIYNDQAGAIGRPIAGYARKNDTIYVSTKMINWASQSTPIHFLGAHDIDLMRWYFGVSLLRSVPMAQKAC